MDFNIYKTHKETKENITKQNDESTFTVIIYNNFVYKKTYIH